MADEKQSAPKKSKPGRVMMTEDVPAYRGNVCLRKGTIQRLDDKATKELLSMGVAEVYEDYEKRVEKEKRDAEAKKRAAEKKAADAKKSAPKA